MGDRYEIDEYGELHLIKDEPDNYTGDVIPLVGTLRTGRNDVSGWEVRMYGVIGMSFDGPEPEMIETIPGVYGGMEEYSRPISRTLSATEIYEEEGNKYKKVDSIYTCKYGSITVKETYQLNASGQLGDGTREFHWFASKKQPHEVKSIMAQTYFGTCPIDPMGRRKPVNPRGLGGQRGGSSRVRE